MWMPAGGTNYVLCGSLLLSIICGYSASRILAWFEVRQLENENLTMRRNILAIRDFDDVADCKAALGVTPISLIERAECDTDRV
jgi:hypothetical protein